MSYTFGGRFPLPRGFSEPIKRSQLDAALGSSPPAVLASVGYFRVASRHGYSPGTVMRADFVGLSGRQTDGVPGTVRPGSVELRIFAIQQAHRRAVELALLSHGLAELVTWLKWLESPGTHREMPHSSTWRWIGERLARDEQ